MRHTLSYTHTSHGHRNRRTRRKKNISKRQRMRKPAHSAFMWIDSKICANDSNRPRMAKFSVEHKESHFFDIQSKLNTLGFISKPSCKQQLQKSRPSFFGPHTHTHTLHSNCNMKRKESRIETKRNESKQLMTLRWWWWCDDKMKIDIFNRPKRQFSLSIPFVVCFSAQTPTQTARQRKNERKYDCYIESYTVSRNHRSKWKVPSLILCACVSVCARARLARHSRFSMTMSSLNGEISSFIYSGYVLFASSLQFVNNSKQNFLAFWFMKCAKLLLLCCCWCVLVCVCVAVFAFFIHFFVVIIVWRYCDDAISFTWSGDIESV